MIRAERLQGAEALAQAGGLLAQTAQNYEALDVKGLALGGLVLCGSRDELSAAVEACRLAHRIGLTRKETHAQPSFHQLLLD